MPKRRTKEEQLADLQRDHRREVAHTAVRASLDELRPALYRRDYDVVRALLASASAEAAKLPSNQPVNEAPAAEPAQLRIDITEFPQQQLPATEGAA